MKNMKKKGFTLVELLVVIAIIAILAVVSVVGYTTFINKANMSADQQAVDQMNTVLEAAQAGGTSLIVEGNDAQTSVNIFKALIENGYNDEFVAYYDKYDFAYVADNGKAYIVLVEAGKVAYPEKYAGKTDFKKFFEAISDSTQLVEALKTGYVLLKTDASFSEAFSVSNSVTIVGDNKLISTETNLSNDTAANSAFNVQGSTEDIEVTLSGLNIENVGASAYERGLNLSKNQGKVTVNIDDCDIKSANYAFNIGGGNDAGVEIVVKDAVINGWAALNVWSKVNITFENCVLIGNSIADQGFGTIVLNRPATGATGAGGSTLTFKNCTLEANNVEGSTAMAILDIRAAVNASFEGCTFKVDGVETDLLTSIGLSDMSDEDKLAIINGSTVTVDGVAVDLTK